METPNKKWLPTPENVNALPEDIREYIHGLETLCDPQFIISQNIFLKDQVDGLQVMYRKAIDFVTMPTFEDDDAGRKAFALGYNTALKDATEAPNQIMVCGKQNPDGTFEAVPAGPATAPLSEEAIKEKLRRIINHALAEGHGRGENGDSLAGTKDFIERLVKTATATEILAAPTVLPPAVAKTASATLVGEIEAWLANYLGSSYTHPIADGVRSIMHRYNQTFDQVVPEGYKLVPITPTNEMFDATRKYYYSMHPGAIAWPCGEAMGIYATMLDAAPPQGEKK